MKEGDYISYGSKRELFKVIRVYEYGTIDVMNKSGKFYRITGLSLGVTK